jgi:hypothetical protein
VNYTNNQQWIRKNPTYKCSINKQIRKNEKGSYPNATTKMDNLDLGKKNWIKWKMILTSLKKANMFL